VALESFTGDVPPELLEITEPEENSHIRHCERTSGSTNVKLQNIQHWE
jgi:hypothetical protein